MEQTINKSKTESGNSNSGLEKFGIALATMVGITFIIAFTGLKKIRIKSEQFIILFPSTLLFLFVISYGDYAYLKWLHKFFPSFFTNRIVLFLRTIPMKWHYGFLVVSTLYVLGVILGFSTYFRKRRLQKSLDAIALSNGLGVKPKIIREIEIDGNKSKIQLVAKGIGRDRFEAKKNDLESAFERIIESIEILPDLRTIEFLVCKKALRRMLKYHEALPALKNSYNFIIGESANGILTADIRELPHMLIAGSTGGGKSAFFRQVFVSLLKNSTHLQVYLIDLKRGIEVKEFGQIPNVRIAKDEIEAVKILEGIRDEMQKRFVFMESNGIKKIDPKLHKRDLIVVGIDEASVLYGRTSSSKVKAESVAKARELTDEISKLARAAGIHLVIATQKAIKDSLDTKTLENLTARMIFKMATHSGSNSALGNAKAYALPDIKGRGIWAGGNKYIEIQSPYLSELELDEECKGIVEKMKEQGNVNFQPMIEIETGKVKDKESYVSKAIPSSRLHN